MLTIMCDVHATRRKRLHHILDEREQALWSGQRIIDAFDWLWENGHERVVIAGDARIFEIAFVRSPV